MNMAATAAHFYSDHFTVHELSDGVFAAIATDGGAAISNAGILDIGRIARELPPAPFSDWALVRFLTANLESFCSKAAAGQSQS
jgi:hypothetical protein